MVTARSRIRAELAAAQTTERFFAFHSLQTLTIPLPLAGQVALVTGSGSLHGVGRAIVLECVRQGARSTPQTWMWTTTKVYFELLMRSSLRLGSRASSWTSQTA